MKFKCSIDIDQPRDLVVRYFSDPQYLKEYQDGFMKKESVSGAEGENGAVAKMYYQQGKREMELTETIIANQLPESIEAFYQHIHMENTMKCTFIELNANQTRYEAEIHYVWMSWFIPRLMGILFPGMFRKQVEKWMKNFKVFVEKQ